MSIATNLFSEDLKAIFSLHLARKKIWSHCANVLWAFDLLSNFIPFEIRKAGLEDADYGSMLYIYVYLLLYYRYRNLIY